MSGVIRWEEPPRQTQGPVHNWAAIAAALQARPGEWALIAVCETRATAGTTAKYVRESFYEPLKTGQYEAKSRTVDGEFRVYARYVGGAQ